MVCSEEPRLGGEATRVAAAATSPAPATQAEKNVSFERINYIRETDILTRVTHVNGWEQP